MEDYPDISVSRAAIIAGISLIIMAILAPIANFSILNRLIVPDNTAKTFSNITSSEVSFRIAILLFFIVAVLDIIVAWTLFIFLKPVNNSLSLLAAWFRVVYAVLLAVALFYLINVLQLMNVAEYLSSLETNQLQIQVMISIKSFLANWEFGLIFFGIHLTLLGYLIFKAGYMRKLLGILIVIAGIGYLIDGFGKIISSDYSISIAIFTFIGEIILIFWLLISGHRAKSTN